jgi:hypothetical protein
MAMPNDPLIAINAKIDKLNPLERAADDRHDFKAAGRLQERLRNLHARERELAPTSDEGARLKLRKTADIVRVEYALPAFQKTARLVMAAIANRKLQVKHLVALRVLLPDAERIDTDLCIAYGLPMTPSNMPLFSALKSVIAWLARPKLVS